MMHSNLDDSVNGVSSRESVNVPMPAHPFIQSNQLRDTLERVSQVLELVQHLDLSEGLDSKAQLGLFRIHQVLAESVEYVSGKLKDQCSE